MRWGLISLSLVAATATVLPEDFDDDAALNLLQVHAAKKENVSEVVFKKASDEAGNWQACRGRNCPNVPHWACDWSGDPHWSRKFHGVGGGDWMPRGVTRMAVHKDNEWEVQTFECGGGATVNHAVAIRIGKCPDCFIYQWGIWGNTFCRNDRCQGGIAGPPGLDWSEGTTTGPNCLISPECDLNVRGGRGGMAITVARDSVLGRGQECTGQFNAADGRCSYCGNPGPATGAARMSPAASIFTHAWLTKTNTAGNCGVGYGGQKDEGFEPSTAPNKNSEELCAEHDERKIEDAARMCGNLEEFDVWFEDCKMDYCMGISELAPWINGLIDEECDEQPGDTEGWPHHHGTKPTTTTMDPANYPPEYYLPHCDTVSEPERTAFPLNGATCTAWAPFWTGGNDCDTSENVLHFDQWSSNGGKAGFFQVKFNLPIEMNKFTMECERAPAFGIRYSNDGRVWKTAALTRTNKVNPSITWEPQGAYKYWRFEIREVPGAWRPGPWYKNLAFFENPGPYCQTVIPPHCSAVKPKRFEQGAPGYETQVCSAMAPTWTGGQTCQDGNGNTNKLNFNGWWVKGGFPGFYQIDLERDVLMVGFSFRIAMSPSWKIRYSDDKLCWFDAIRRAIKPKKDPKVMFGGNSGAHKHWRYEITGNWGPSKGHWYNSMIWYYAIECQSDVPGECSQAPSYDSDDSNAYCEANAHHWLPKANSNGCTVTNGQLRFHPWQGNKPVSLAKFGQEAYYQIDFPAPRLIAGVTYQTEYSKTHIMHPFQVLCSDDAVNWLPVFEMKTPRMTWDTNTDIEHRWPVVGEKRYWRYQLMAGSKHVSNNPNAAYRDWRWQEVEHCLWTTTPTTTTTIAAWKTVPPTTTPDRGNVVTNPDLPLDASDACVPAHMESYYCTALAPHWGPTAEKKKGSCNTATNNLHFSGWQQRTKNQGGGGGGSVVCQSEKCAAYWMVDTFSGKDFCSFTLQCADTPNYDIQYCDGGAPGSEPESWDWKVACEHRDTRGTQHSMPCNWDSVGKHRYWRYVPLDNSGQWHYNLQFWEGHTYGQTAAPTELCEVDDYNLKIDTVVNSNLGGMGPDYGEDENIRYANVLRRGEQDIDMIVVADSAYTGKTSKNGVTGDGAGAMGVVSIWTGTQVDLTFQFVKSGTKEPVEVDNFLFSVLDMDIGRKGKGQESMTFDSTANGCARSYRTNPSEVQVAGNVYTGTTHGTGKDNPTNLKMLTEQQEARSVVFRCGGVSQMKASFAVGPGNGARNFHFAGASSLACPPERSTKTTTTTPGPNCPAPLPRPGGANSVKTCGVWRDPHVVRNFYDGPAFDQYHEGVVDVMQSRDGSLHVQAFMCDSGAGTTSVNALAIRNDGDYISFLRGPKTKGRDCDWACMVNPLPAPEDMWILSVNGHRQDYNAMPRAWPGGTWMLQLRQKLGVVPLNKDGQSYCMGDYERRFSMRLGMERGSKHEGKERFMVHFQIDMQEDYIASVGLCGTSAGRNDIGYADSIFTTKEMSSLCDICKMRKGADEFNLRGELRSEGCKPPAEFHGAASPDEVCRQASIPPAEAQSKCASLDGENEDQKAFYRACQVEYCASGGDPVEVEMANEEEHFEQFHDKLVHDESAGTATDDEDPMIAITDNDLAENIPETQHVQNPCGGGLVPAGFLDGSFKYRYEKIQGLTVNQCQTACRTKGGNIARPLNADAQRAIREAGGAGNHIWTAWTDQGTENEWHNLADLSSPAFCKTRGSNGKHQEDEKIVNNAMCFRRWCNGHPNGGVNHNYAMIHAGNRESDISCWEAAAPQSGYMCVCEYER